MYNKNLVFIIPTLKSGGAERVVSILTQNLDSNSKYLLLFQNKIDYTYTGNLVACTEPNKNDKNSKVLKVLMILKAFFFTVKLKLKLKNTITISFMRTPNFINILTGFGGRTIISVRTNESKSLENYPKYSFFNKKLIIYLYSRADYIVTPSKSVGLDLINNFKVNKDKIKNIYNPVNLKDISLKKEVKLDDKFEMLFNLNIICSVGSLKIAKGHCYLFRIFAKFLNQNNNYKLVCIGDGPLRNKLIEYGENLGLKVYSDNNNMKYSLDYDIYLLGQQDNVYNFLNKSNIFVLTSLWEGLPNVILEAMAVGVPIISSDCDSGPRELLSPKSDFWQKCTKIEIAKFGILIPPFRDRWITFDYEYSEVENMWIEALYLIKNNKEILSDTCDHVKNFDILKIKNDWEELLNDENK